jgi:ComEC/Rec2-related protein
MSSPRLPLFGAAMMAIAGIVLADITPPAVAPVGLAAGICAIVGLLRPRTWLTLPLVFAAYFVLHQNRNADAPGKMLSLRLGDRLREVAAIGTVTSEPKLSPNDYTTFLCRLSTIELERGPEPTTVTVRVRWKGSPQFGDELGLHGLIGPIPPARNPGVFGLRPYLARRDVYQEIFVRYLEDGRIERTGGGNVILRVALRTRTWMQATLARGLEDSPELVALINGMALGVRHDSPNDIEEPFQKTGTLHLFAVAGLHVGIVAQLLWIVTSLLRFPRKVAAAAIIPALFFYSAITGLHVSSVRAATMAGFLLGGIFFERPVLALNSLAGAAVLILAFDTQQLFTSGFQLSFSVVAAILTCREPIFHFLLRWGAPDPFLPRSLVRRSRRLVAAIYRRVAGGLAVSAAAWIGSLVLIDIYFFLFTPISLFANLAVVPIAFFVLAIGLISLLSAAFSTALSVIFNQANWSLANLIFILVHWFARVPAGHWYLEPPHWPPTAKIEITVLDAGAGAAIHLRSKDFDWLFDSGSARDYERFLRDYLHSRGINRLNGLPLSHGDSLHIGGALPLLDEFKPRQVLDNGASDRSSVHRALVARLTDRQLLARGDNFSPAPRITAHVLYPPPASRTKAADDQALVVQLQIGQRWRVLLMSDNGSATEAALLSAPNELRSDILIKGQHYSGQSGSVEFLDAVRPQLIIASSVDFPTRERIPDEWEQMVRQRGISLFRQDRTGAVRLEFSNREWRATGFITQETLRRVSR